MSMSIPVGLNNKNEPNVPISTVMKSMENQGLEIRSRCSLAYQKLVVNNTQSNREDLQRAVGELAIYVRMRHLMSGVVPMDASVKRLYRVLISLEDELSKVVVKGNVFDGVLDS